MSYCFVCGTPDPQHTCGRCKHPRYCSKECQVADWEEALHQYECYDLADPLGEVAMDIAVPLPTSNIHPDEIEFGKAILEAEDEAEAIAWLRENRMNTYVAAHENLELHADSLQQHIGLAVDHGMAMESLIGQAILKDFTQRIELIEGVRDWLSERWGKLKDWRQHRKDKKKQERQGRYQTKARRAEGDQDYYRSKLSQVEEDRRQAKWYQFLKKRKLRRQERKYESKFGKAAVKQQRYMRRSEPDAPPVPSDADAYGQEEYWW